MKLKFIVPILLLFSLVTCNASSQEESKSVPHLASYWHKIKDKVLQCDLCPRRCVLDNGQRGFCTVRINKDGTLYTLGYGNPVAVHVDPIEKKPFFHVLPGTTAFSLAVAGCNMRCLFCQNWQISQSRPDEVPVYDLPPEKVVDEAIESGSPFIVYTYTEPTVFYEYMLDIAKIARAKGLKNAMHTCGYINPEPLKELLKYMDAVNVDLKSFNPEFYKKMGSMAELEPVLETLKEIKRQGVWLEITNLVIPGQNDDPAEIAAMCRWISDNLGDDVPVHFSRFMPSFRLQNLPPTPFEKLDEIYGIAKAAPLKYVYIGNVPGSGHENTYCPQCGALLIKRIGYQVSAEGLTDGKCKKCARPLEGIWRR
ncbi:MAG: AmmeMemoRadiSam system radical SAM enzyme [Candidatus Omnitrophica bacterium]|nr:AmmeMemoRadiSam system radical SAM enzyme [Candidatus Omnitrophota bacterium]